jgi:hypothetical protein
MIVEVLGLESGFSMPYMFLHPSTHSHQLLRKSEGNKLKIKWKRSK